VRHGTCFHRRLAARHAGAAPHSAVAELGVVRRLRTRPVNTNHLKTGLQREPDVEAEITLFSTEAGGRQTPAGSGYRPGHKVRDDYITTGAHQYVGRDELAPGETALGTITFITPEVYPHCLWVGREIDIQEGSRVIGRARITKIYNAILANVA
jgi:translation elongation factor EF-Tu-like GTPase